MKNFARLLTLLAAGVSLVACGANANGGAVPTSQAQIANNVLQFAVGTANYAGAVGLNVVTTYRQAAGSSAPGDSGTLLNSPTIKLPNTLPGLPPGAAAAYDPLSTVLTGPATGELGGDAITPSSQSATASTVTSFGQSGGAFGLGIEPFNAQGSSSVGVNGGSPANNGTPYQVAPYPIPLYDATAGDPNILIPWGGPPAFDATSSNGDSIVGNLNYPTGSAGLSEGIDVFEGVAPVAGGAYSLNVTVPANTGTLSRTASFTMPGTLTTIATPVSPAFAPDGNGGGSLAGFVMPANATEAYVEIVDYGPANGGTSTCATASTVGSNTASASAPLYYTLETGTSTLPALADSIGPGGSSSVCTGDQIVVQVIAFDYPAFESSYPNSLGNPSPVILGAHKSDDIAISAATCTTIGGTSCTSTLPLLKRRQLQAAYARPLERRHPTP